MNNAGIKKMLPKPPRLGGKSKAIRGPRLPRPDDYKDMLRSVERSQWERPAPAGLGALFCLIILIFFVFVLPKALLG